MTLDSEEIIEEINDIYEEFDIPQNLREHMMRVAGAVALICDNWKGSKINKDDVVAAALLHDLGNVVKYDLSPEGRRLVGDDSDSDVETLKELQQKMITKYGKDADAASAKMAQEAGVNERVLELIAENGIDHIEDTANSNDMERKILKYCDLRVLPGGIGSLDERFEDARVRYSTQNVFAKALDENQLIAWKETANRIETDIFKNVKKGFKPGSITDKSVSKYIEEFMSE
jgi:hypothetical protein